jgi:hypothetical protein
MILRLDQTFETHYALQNVYQGMYPALVVVLVNRSTKSAASVSYLTSTSSHMSTHMSLGRTDTSFENV